jgi:hypothetical protein
LLVAFAAIAVLAVAALAAVPWLVDTPRVQGYLASSASQALGRPVKFESVSVTAFPWPAVALRGLEVAEDPRFGTAPFLRLDRADVRLKIRPLLSGRVEFGELVLKSPVISLVHGADGRWNVASLGVSREPAGPPRPSRGGGVAAGGGAIIASRIRITNGVIVYEDRGPGATGRYRVENFDLRVKGGQNPLAFEGSARVVPGDLKVTIADGTLAPAAGRPLFDAPVGARVTLDGKNVGTLAAAALGPSPTLDGALKATLKLTGQLGNPRAAGQVEVTPLNVSRVEPQCPEPRRRTLGLTGVKLDATWSEGKLVATPLATGVGKGTVTTAMTATLGTNAHADLRDLTVNSVPVEKILVDFLCQSYAVTGPLDLSAGALAFDARDPLGSLSGGGRLKIGPGQVVGSQALELVASVLRVGGAVSSLLGGQLPTSLGKAPLEYESIAGTYQITRGVVTTRDLLFTSREIRMAVAGEYGLVTGRLNLDVTVNPGRGELRAKVTGTTASPSIRVQPSSLVGPVDPGRVERGLQDLLKRFR